MPAGLLRRTLARGKPGWGARLNRAHPQALGLVGAWLLNERGIAVRDYAGLADGTLAGGGSVTDGTLLLDGTDDVANLGTSDPLGSGSPWTVVARIAPTGASGGEILAKRDAFSAGNDAFGFNVGGNGVGQPTVVKDATYFNFTTLAIAATGAWQHVAMMADAASAIAYLDGATETNGADWSTGSAPTATLAIGLDVVEGANAFAGRIDWVYLFNRKLTVDEVARIVARPYAMFDAPLWRRYLLPPSGQVAYPVADVSDGSWLNESGSNVNLYASLDETAASDADYIISSSSPAVADEAKVRLGPLTDPAASGGHVVRWRYSKDVAAGDRIDLEVRLYAADGTTQIASQTITDVGAVATGALTLSGAEADAIPSADYATGLVLGFRAVKV